MESWWELGQWAGYRNTGEIERDIICAFCYEKGHFRKLDEKIKESKSRNRSLHYGTFSCINCGNIIFAVWAGSRDVYNFYTLPFPLKTVRPPKEWPPDVGQNWVEAKQAAANELWRAAAMMTRTTMQLAFRHVGARGSTLAQEVISLAEEGKIPPLMAEWATELRLLGNTTAHPTPMLEENLENSSLRKDVQYAMRFLDFLLRYLFTLPVEISKIREKMKEEKHEN